MHENYYHTAQYTVFDTQQPFTKCYGLRGKLTSKQYNDRVSSHGLDGTQTLLNSFQERKQKKIFNDSQKHAIC